MRNNSALLNCPLSTRNALKQGQALLQLLITLDVDQISSRNAMLSNKNRLPGMFQFGQKLSGPPLQGCNKFRAHEVILKCQQEKRNPQYICVCISGCI